HRRVRDGHRLPHRGPGAGPSDAERRDPPARRGGDEPHERAGESGVRPAALRRDVHRRDRRVPGAGGERGQAERSAGGAEGPPGPGPCPGSNPMSEAMSHPSPDELVLYPCGESADPAALEAHVAACPECKAAFESLRTAMGTVAMDEAPARGADYGAQVWQRLEPKL